MPLLQQDGWQRLYIGKMMKLVQKKFPNVQAGKYMHKE